MEIEPSTLPWNTLYKILVGSVLPRPIGWVSTISVDGIPNLAPFSFFNAVCANPPTLLFCPMTRGTDGKSKDTLNNLRANGEFVINIVTEPLAEAMNATSVEIDSDISEFELAGLGTTPALTVRPPRVSLSPIHFECRVHQIVEIGAEPGGGNVVIGRIIHLHVDESVITGDYRIDLAALKPIGKLAGNHYCRVTDLFEMVRPPSQIKS